MNKFERRIVGKEIRAIEPVEDYIQVFFYGGGFLNLYNPVTPFDREPGSPSHPVVYGSCLLSGNLFAAGRHPVQP